MIGSVTIAQLNRARRNGHLQDYLMPYHGALAVEVDAISIQTNEHLSDLDRLDLIYRVLVSEFGEPGESRHKRNAEFRHLFAYFARKFTSLSLKDIGRQIGKHHSTVIHSFHVVDGWIAWDKEYKKKVERLRERIGL